MSDKLLSSFSMLVPIFVVFAVSPSKTNAVTVEVRIENFTFNPAQVTIKPGDTVHWTSPDSGHTTTSGPGCGADGTWDAAIRGSGFSRTFDTVGEYPYFCRPHCQFGMKGTVKVVNSTPVAGPGNTLDDPIPKPIDEGNIVAKLLPVASGLTAPGLGVAAPGDKKRLFVVDQIGILWAIDLKSGEKTKFGDLSSLLVPLGIAGPGSYDERGLLGLAFHPRYRSNGLLYTFTSEPARENPDFSTQASGIAPDHQSVIREWRVPLPKKFDSVIDPDSSRVLLRIDKPQFNHNGGSLAFGKDGMLYVSTGDGGNADDQGDGHSAQGNAQDKSNVLGKILRINPISRTARNRQYGIPGNNPFKPKGKKAVLGGQAGCADGNCDEIFALGLRNPYRMSFDTATGKLYVADTGQNSVEEVDVIRAGKNYGWPIKEGAFCFDNKGDDPGVVTDAACGPSTLVDPVAEYDHDEGKAIIGGFVYRGKKMPRLRGRYVFGDYAKTFHNDGRLFYLANGNVAGGSKDRKSEPREFGFTDPAAPGLSLLGFGQDAQGELYVLGNSTGFPSGNTGVVFKIAP